MAVVFPNIDTEQFMWRKAATAEKKLDSELEKFLVKPNTNRMATPETNKIRVEWPTILSSDCSTWLSTRKAESDKKQSEKEKAEINPWLVKGGAMSAIDLANTVRMGLLKAGSVEALETSEDKSEKSFESRIPLPMTEEVSVPMKKEEEVTVASQPISLASQVKMGLMRAGSIPFPPGGAKDPVKNQPKPWAPKSLVGEVRMGLLRAGGQLKYEVSNSAMKHEVYNPVTTEETVEPEVETESAAGPVESLAETLKKSLLNIKVDPVNIEETVEPEVEKESAPCPVESLAETLKKSLLDIKVDQLASPLKTSMSDNLRESLLNLSTFDAEESKSESLDNWIMDDNQSEASIITLDTITDSMDMEDFDDFEDMEHELSMWIAKA